MAQEDSTKVENKAVDNKVILHGFPRSTVLPNISPFVLKVESWLRMNKIPYEFTDQNPTHSKTGKAPWIEYQGESIYDSQRIIEYLSQKLNIKLYNNVEDGAIMRAFQVMLDEHAVFGTASWRWVRDPEQKALSTLSHKIGSIKMFAMKMIMKRAVKNSLYYQGLGRMEQNDADKSVNADYQALSDYLGKKPYIMGQTAQYIDAVAFAQLVQILYLEQDSPMYKYIKENCENLVEFVERFKAAYFGDWDDLLASNVVRMETDDTVIKPIDEKTNSTNSSSPVLVDRPPEEQKI